MGVVLAVICVATIIFYHRTDFFFFAVELFSSVMSLGYFIYAKKLDIICVFTILIYSFCQKKMNRISPSHHCYLGDSLAHAVTVRRT
jgi:hypothetical protein